MKSAKFRKSIKDIIGEIGNSSESLNMFYNYEIHSERDRFIIDVLLDHSKDANLFIVRIDGLFISIELEQDGDMYFIGYSMESMDSINKLISAYALPIIFLNADEY